MVISEIWSELDSDILSASFDQCGITSNDPLVYHSQLRHFINNHEIIEDIIPGDILGDHVNLGFNPDSNEEDLPSMTLESSDEEIDDDDQDDDSDYHV